MEKALAQIKKIDIFGDMYLYDKDVKSRIARILESEECKELLKKAESESALSLLGEVVPEGKSSWRHRVFSAIYPFYRSNEYKNKEAYLQYLKKVYGFLMTPFEEAPPEIMKLLYPERSKDWEPSHELAVELLKKFYLEAELIKEISDADWERIRNSNDPESAITHLIFKPRFRPEFEEFLNKIPWFISRDLYASPALDSVAWEGPGTKLPKKPVACNEEFFEILVKESLSGHAYREIVSEDGKELLSDKKQIIEEIENKGAVIIDSYIGLTKIEKDFVVHQRIIIWEQPVDENAKPMRKLRMRKSSPYLYVIREEAVPLEIPFMKGNVGNE